MSNRFDIIDTLLKGLKVLQRNPIGDARGYLERLYCANDLQSVLGNKPIVQVNRTFTAKRGTVRGLHLQRAPHAETKLVSCLHGEVFDVAVDLRHNSATFMQWHGQVLSADNHLAMLIPEGFAHGLQTLTDSCELLYLHTAAFHPEAEAGFNARDPRFAIGWPEKIIEQSARDAGHPMLTPQYTGVTL